MTLRTIQALKNYIETSTSYAPISSDEQTRLQHYSIFLIAGIPTMFIFGVYTFMKGNYFLFLLILLSALGLIIGWLFLQKIENGRIVYRINTILFCLLILYMLLIGGQGGSKILWMYIFPLISFFLFGRKEGFFWSATVLMLATLLLFIPIDSPIVYVYPNEFKTRFMASYIIVTAVTYWFEFFRYHYRKDLEFKNTSLEREISERKHAEKEREKLIVELKKALEEVKTLSGFLPICASCKKVRDDKGYWSQIESYIKSHSDAEFSHGICPDCARRLYPSFMVDKKRPSDKDRR